MAHLLYSNLIMIYVFCTFGGSHGVLCSILLQLCKDCWDESWVLKSFHLICFWLHLLASSLLFLLSIPPDKITVCVRHFSVWLSVDQWIVRLWCRPLIRLTSLSSVFECSQLVFLVQLSILVWFLKPGYLQVNYESCSKLSVSWFVTISSSGC